MVWMSGTELGLKKNINKPCESVFENDQLISFPLI
jgi:hypothetical protein